MCLFRSGLSSFMQWDKPCYTLFNMEQFFFALLRRMALPLESLLRISQIGSQKKKTRLLSVLDLIKKVLFT